MANNDGGQGWITVNLPYDTISVIVCSTAQYIRTVVCHSPVTPGRYRLTLQLTVMSMSIKNTTVGSPADISTSSRFERRRTLNVGLFST